MSKTVSKQNSERSGKKKLEMPLDFNDGVTYDTPIEPCEEEYTNMTPEECLMSFINKYKVGKDDEYSHVLLDNPYTSFRVPDTEYATFYELLRNVEGIQSIAEVYPKNSPLIVDIEFVKKTVEKKRLYEISHVENTVKLLIKILKKYIVVKNENLSTFILEKNNVIVSKGNVIDSFRIQFQDICLSQELRYIIRGDFISSLIRKNIYKTIPHDNDLNTIWNSDNIEKSPIIMYGCSQPNSLPFKVTNVFDFDCKKIPLKLFSAKHIVKTLSARKYKNDVHDELLNKIKLSVDLAELEEKYKKQTVQQPVKKIGGTFIKKALTKEDYDSAVILSEMLSSKRANDPILCMQVGWALHNIDYNLLSSWIKFVKLGDKPKSEQECTNDWARFKERNYYLASLNYWALLDNKEKYEKYKTDKIGLLVKNSIAGKGTPYRIALVLLEMYKYKFVCTSLKHKEWFEYRNHKWEIVEEGYTLSRSISTDLVTEFGKLNSVYLSIAGSHNITPDEKESALKKFKQIGDIIMKLETTAFKNNIMAEARELFYDNKFLEKIDENRHLLGCKNGVYDLENHCFRAGCPDDYIRLSTKIDYYEYDEEDENIKNVANFMKQLQTGKIMRRYLWLLMASYIQGNIPDERFHIWTGSGCHGIGEKIMMHNNSIKVVEDIVVGDVLMGDDNCERNVKQLFRGRDKMYRVKQGKGSYVVNQHHILSLMAINVVGIQTDTSGVRVFWKEREGRTIVGKNILCMTEKIAEKLIDSFEENPKIIKPGEIIDIELKEWLSIKDNMQESSFCGYKATGEKYKLKFEYLGIDDYYGFELDGNGRYLMHDYTVTHNSNGKSKLILLMQYALGEYAGTFSVALLTKKRGASSGPTPDLADKKGIRFGAFQEPEEDDKINVGLMKELTGGDRILSRALFKDPLYFYPQFKLLLACNKVPSVTATDGGTMRRLRVIPFSSKFVDVPKNKNEFKMDIHLTEKLIEWKEAFLATLIHYYKEYKNNGIIEPEEVLKYTKDYQKKCDIYSEFLTENVYKTEDESNVISFNSLYSIFRVWYKDSISEKSIPTKKDLKEYINSKTELEGLLIGNNFIKHKLLSSKDDEEESNNAIKSINKI